MRQSVMEWEFFDDDGFEFLIRYEGDLEIQKHGVTWLLGCDNIDKIIEALNKIKENLND